MRVLITGAAGMLGRDLEKVFSPGNELMLTDITGDASVLDITDTDQVMRAVGDFRPDVVVHGAAYTDVDGCERDPDTAFRVNGLGTWNLAAACAEFDSAIAYVSTDYVFDGEKGSPYVEYDPVNPQGHYGASKLAGETHVKALCRKHYIVRTAWLYGVHGKSFPRTMLNAARAGKDLKVISDQVGSPTFTRDLAGAIREICSVPLYGTYHATNKGKCSWFDFAKKIFETAGLRDVKIAPIRSDDWPSPTKRPKYSVLRHYALELQGRDNMRPWEDALADFIREFDD